MNHTIIYHQSKPGTDCPDGIMAAAIAAMYLKEQGQSYQFLGDSYRHADDYGAKPDRDFVGEALIIVDFSYPAHWLQYWETQGAKITVIDHHEPKFPMLSGFAGAVLDASECGATLTWKHFFPNRPMPGLLMHVRRRDIGADGYYDGSVPESEAINEGLSWMRQKSKSANSSVIDLLIELLGDRLASLRCFKRGVVLIEERDRIVKEACCRAISKELSGFSVPFVQLETHEDRYYSQIGNKLCKLYYHIEFAWVKTSDGGNHLRSLSSGYDFDVSKVAESLGGGGHRHAAGFKDKS